MGVFISTHLLKVALCFTVLFAGCIGLIRAQPYDDSELRTFLAPPEGCPAPCFMGIRPGITTYDEALAILRAHRWIGEISVPQAGSVTWRWNGLQPPVLNARRENFGGDYAGYIRFNSDNTVLGVTVPTRIRFGDISLFFGKPHLFDHLTIRIEGVDFKRSQYCVGRPPYYWHTPVMISSWDYSRFGGTGFGVGPDCV
jgi:hypothetical protein